MARRRRPRLTEEQTRTSQRLRLAALVCAVAALPVVLVGMLVADTAGVPREDQAWAMLGLLLLPVAWALWLADLRLRHRWVGSRRTRSDLAGFLVVTGAVALVVAVILAVFGLVEGYPWLVAGSALGAVIAGALVWHEASLVRPGRSDGDGDVTTIVNSITNSID